MRNADIDSQKPRIVRPNRERLRFSPAAWLPGRGRLPFAAICHRPCLFAVVKNAFLHKKPYFCRKNEEKTKKLILCCFHACNIKNMLYGKIRKTGAGFRNLSNVSALCVFRTFFWMSFEGMSEPVRIRSKCFDVRGSGGENEEKGTSSDRHAAECGICFFACVPAGFRTGFGKIRTHEKNQKF